jgi:TPR repeat protein
MMGLSSRPGEPQQLGTPEKDNRQGTAETESRAGAARGAWVITIASERSDRGLLMAIQYRQTDHEFAGACGPHAEADALFDLGLIYAAGRDGEPDLIAAHKWFNLAALKGRADALAQRREVAELMSDVEIALAQRAARAWITTH